MEGRWWPIQPTLVKETDVNRGIGQFFGLPTIFSLIFSTFFGLATLELAKESVDSSPYLGFLG
jgi:hypothetical protein